jgi:hypothetical protein
MKSLLSMSMWQVVMSLAFANFVSKTQITHMLLSSVRFMVVLDRF